MGDLVTISLTVAAGDSGHIAISIALIAVGGVLAQWLAWRVRLPSILLLLIAGLIAGPVMRAVAPGSVLALDPDRFLGDLLLPLVGVSVGLILFEGGLTLSFHEVRSRRRTIALLVTLGAIISWVVTALAARFVLGLPTSVSVLIGAILVVTGPTVIGPLLNHIRPSGAVGPILKWEGIVIDPIGVLLAVLVFEAILIGHAEEVARSVAWNIFTTLIVGGGLGTIAALILVRLMERYWLPDFLQNPFSLMLVVSTFVLSNEIQTESGLLATTVMGVVVANQTKADVRHILEFKENLRVLLISSLFIILGARLDVASLQELNWIAVAAFILILVLIGRPASVFCSTVGSDLTLREKLFLCCMAPRGIVAAAGASIFSLALEAEVNAGALTIEGVGQIVPITFIVIIATVTFYGLVAPFAARTLGVSDQNPQGILFIGCSPWVRAVAAALKKRNLTVLLVDTNRINVRAAKMEHLPAWQGSILAEYALRELDLRGIGRVFALTPNEEVNTLALQRLSEHFDTAGLYTLPLRTPRKKGEEKAATVRGIGRHLFDADIDLETIESRFEKGWVIKATTLSQEFTFEDWRLLYGPHAVVMFVISPTGTVTVVSAERELSPEPGSTIIGLVNPDELLFA